MNYQLSLNSLLLHTLISCLQVIRGPGCKQAAASWVVIKSKTCKGKPRISLHIVNCCSYIHSNCCILTFNFSGLLRYEDTNTAA